MAELAEVQHGVVAVWQLYLLGFSARAVERRIENGRLHRIHRGVYAVGHARLTERGQWMAAVLACGEDSLLSHRSNAGLRSYMPDGRAVIDVTAPGRSRHSRGKLRVHCPRALHPDDVAVYDGIPCTSVPLLLLDVAETEPRRHLERIWEAAERERQLDLRAVRELLERSPGRRGCKPLTLLLAQFRDPEPRTRSKLEKRFFAECRRRGIDRPEVNALVEEIEVDMLWRGPKVVVELDGWDTHRTRAAFERDRARDVRLQLMGYRVLRFTWRQLEIDPQSVIDAVQKLIRAVASVAPR
jgi:very-short-patch-repair endonuclease